MARRLRASYEIWADQQARFFIPEGDPFENNIVLNRAIEPLFSGKDVTWFGVGSVRSSRTSIASKDVPAALALLRFHGFEIEQPGTIPFNSLIPY